CGLSDFECERDEPAVSDLVLGQPELLASGADEDGVAVSDQIPESPDHGERERVERRDVHLGASAAENLVCAGGYERDRGTREGEEQDPIVGFAFCYSFKMGVSCGERAGRLSDTRPPSTTVSSACVATTRCCSGFCGANVMVDQGCRCVRAYRRRLLRSRT